MQLTKSRQGRFITGVTALVAVMLVGCSGTPSGAETLTSHRPDGVVQPSKPFAGLPFGKASMGDKLIVSGEWNLDSSEVAVLGPNGGHEALDFQPNEQKPPNPDHGCGIPVVAAFSGTVIASIQLGVIRGYVDPPLEEAINEDWTNPDTGRTGYVGFGGLLIELISDEVIPGKGRITAQYMHLGSIEDRFRVGDGKSGPWVEPVVGDPLMHVPTGEKIQILTPKDLRQSEDTKIRRGVRVEKGEVLGTMGDTGIFHAYQDQYDPVNRTVLPRDRAKFPAWDPCQLHFQTYAGRENGSKINIFDPMDHYGVAEGTPGPTEANPEPGKVKLGPSPLFQRDENGFAEFAAP